MSSRYSDDRRVDHDHDREERDRHRSGSGRDRLRERERDDRPRRVADERDGERYRVRDRERDDRHTGHRDRSTSPDRHRHRHRHDHHRESRRADSRSRSRSRSPDSKGRRRRRSDDSESESGSGTDSGSGSESEDSRDRRRRKKEKERRKDKKRDKESREERKARKARKKEKKHKKTAAVTSQWGTYGIIADNDFVNKQSEFRAWLVEERKINPETVSKDKERKEFSRFVEDFNTATLPHEKYYDMAKYEIKMQMIRTGGSMPLEMLDGGYDPNADLAAHSSSLKRPSKDTQSFLSRDQLEELRRVQNERIEVAQRKVLGMDVSKNLGVRQEEQNKMWR